MTLEQYLRRNFHRPDRPFTIDHMIRANVDSNGTVTFYIRPANVDGDTLNFEVHGNTLVPNPRVTKG